MGRLRPTIYDPHRIERQVKSRTLTKGWLAATLLGSALVGSFAFLMPWSSGIAVYLLIAGVTIIFVYAYWSAVTVGDNEKSADLANKLLSKCRCVFRALEADHSRPCLL